MRGSLHFAARLNRAAPVEMTVYVAGKAVEMTDYVAGKPVGMKLS